MEYSDSQILEKQLAELCKIYENKTAVSVNLIRETLKKRQKLKAKIIEDKEHATSLFQIIERLDESEKVTRLQLEAANKIEDPESLEQLKIIKKYENMVREQRAVWAKYEEEYEQLPMAQERRKVKLQILKTSIQVKLLKYKIEEKKKMINMKNQISKRKEQLAIINFAKFMVEYKKREKDYCELRGKINTLKRKEQELRHQTNELEQLNINRDNKILVVEEQPSVKKLTLPPMDLSGYIVSQKSVNNHYNNTNPDTVSMYSLTLEQEYMNSEVDEVGKDSSKVSAKPSQMETSYARNSEESQDTNAETSMDVDTEEFLYQTNQANVNPQYHEKTHSNIHNGENSKKNTQESAKISGRDGSKKRANQNLQSEDYSNSENVRDEQRNGNKQTERPVPTPAKMLKHLRTQEDYSNVHNQNGRTACSPEVAAKVHNWQRSASPKKKAMNRDLLLQLQQQQQQFHREQQEFQHQFQQQKLQRQQNLEQQQKSQHQSQRPPLQQQQRPPLQQRQPQQQLHSQEQRQSAQQQQQQTSRSPKQRQSPDEQNFKPDLTRLPQSSKPQMKSNERVHYDTQKLLQNQQMSHKTMKQAVVTPISTITYDDNETLDESPQTVHQLHVAPNQNKTSMHEQSEQLVTPQYHNISSDSMMSANICTDSNVSADNISAIIGSDITEPGGIAGLIKHLYGDSDGTSDEVNMDNLVTFCSPLPQNNSNLQQQPVHNENYQKSVQFNEATANHDPQEATNRNFNFLQFQQTNQEKSSQRLF